MGKTEKGLNKSDIQQLADILKNGSRSMQELHKLTGNSKEQLKQALSYLIREEKVTEG